MSLLDGLKVTDKVEEAKDTLGGVSVLDSNVYPMTIVSLYMGQSQSGAKFLALHAKTSDGKDFKNTQYITSNASKGAKPYYEKDGKKNYLPGFNVMNAVLKLTIDKELGDLTEDDLEEKVIKLYDYDAKAEVPTKVQMLTEALGHTIALGIQKQIVDKNKKNDATGEYEPTGETKEVNEISAVFSAETGLTLMETKTGQEEPEFLNKWKEKNKDQVINKAKGLEGSTGKISKSEPAKKTKPTKSLFS